MRYISILSLFLLLFTGCWDDEDQFSTDDQIIKQYLADNGLEATTVVNDVYCIIEEKGDGGSPGLDSMITIKYKGYLTDGTVFDETEEDTTHTIMLRNTLYGLVLGIPELQKGGKGTFLIPSPWGIGSSSTSKIPANSVLIFDIELVDFETIEAYNERLIQNYITENQFKTDNVIDGIHYIIEEEGTGSYPTYNSKVSVKYKGTLLDGTVFDETKDGESRTFYLDNLISGWKISIPLLKEGGKGTFLIPSYLGYGNQLGGKIPPNSPLIFEIELVSFE